MSPNDIKRIINVVVDYGWPVQIGYEGDTNDEYWETMEYENVEPVLVIMGHILDYDPVRLDPNHEHDWPIETREGMPCWIKRNEKWQKAICGGEGCIYAYGVSGWTAMTYGGTFVIDEVTPVAPHPLNPTMEPPLDWSPEGKRILK